MTDAVSEYDSARAEAFVETLVGHLNGASLALMISIGHRTGLFDAMADLPPSDSAAIAAAAGLDERYVREWLGAMTTGRVVDHDAETGRWWLPAEHAASLVRSAAPDNIAVTTQWISVLASVEDRIVQCFREGGGVSYEEYPRFHEVMAEESGQTVVAALEESILPLVPKLIDELNEGLDVLDVGCGSGQALVAMARAFPRSRFKGYDLSEEAVASGRKTAAGASLHNLGFERRDLVSMGEEGAFDLVTAFDIVHDQADPAAVLAAVKRALRPGGVFLMQDIRGSSHVHENMDHNLAPFLYTISCMHCMTVSLAQGGAGLGAMWGQELAERMLGEAGFEQLDVLTLPHDEINVYYVSRASA